MSNSSYGFSFSNYETIHRLVTLYCNQYESSLYGQVVEDVEGFENLEGEVTLRILNKRTRSDSRGRTYEAPFPNLVQVPVLNAIQNITLPKVSVGQRGIIIFNKNHLPDQIGEDDDLSLPNPRHIFKISDALFIPVAPQVSPRESTTTVDSEIMQFVSDKFEVMSSQNFELITVIRDLINAIGEVSVMTGDSPINTLAPEFPTNILRLTTFINE